MTTNDDFEHEWREGVNTQLKDLTKQTAQNTTAIERTVGAVDALVQRVNRHESDHNAAPVNARSQWQVLLMAGGCLTSCLAILVAIVGSILIPLIIFYLTNH